MFTPRVLSFSVGVGYAVFSLAAVSASQGYRLDIENDQFGFRAFLEGTALLSAVSFIASLGLIYGVMEGRSVFLSAWLTVQVVVPLYSAAFYGWAIFASGYKSDFGPVRNFVPFISIVAAVHILAMVGCTVIVNNYYAYLKLGETMKKKQEELE